MTTEDDDFDIIPTKICKLDTSLNQSETCIICMELFTISGDHKLVSIKCGHTFGQKCIVTWLSKGNNQCPNCKANASKNDVRPVFIDIPLLKIEDNTELVSTLDELQKTKIKLRESELECSHLFAKCNGFVAENLKLHKEIDVLTERTLLVEYHNSKTEQSSTVDSSFKIINRILVSSVGDCRVMAYADLDKTLCVSAPSPNKLYAGYGVRMVSVRHNKLLKFLHLHTKMVRDIAFSPYNMSDHMLTCSLDKYVKLTSLKTEKTVATYLSSCPVWSCAWSNNNYIFYAGLSNGTIEEIDTRKTTTPVSSVWSQAGGPVLSMSFVSGNKHIDQNGLIVTNSQNVLFLNKSLLEPSHEAVENDNAQMKINTLLLSSDYGGSLIHTSFNDRTCHLLNTFRPTSNNKSQFLLSQMGSTRTNNVAAVYATDSKSYYGGTKKDFMNRSCFLDDGDSAKYVVCPDEESLSIKIWDTNSECVTLYPKDVSRQKPILDVCQYSTDPLSFAALNCSHLYLYSQ